MPASRPWSAPAFVRYWHLASLDAPTVAVVWTLGFAWAAGVRLAAWVMALQVLAVWVVYVGDRLLDAQTGLNRTGLGKTAVNRLGSLSQQPEADLRERHYFHWRHRRILLPAACAAACAAACITWCSMPIGVKERDSVLAAAAAVYFICVHAGRVRSMLRKEMVVGVLFAAGCALPAASRAVAVPAIFFAALAWLNCWAIERWESPLSLPGATRPRSIAIALAAAGVLAAALLAPVAPRAAAMVVAGAVSAVLLAVLDGARSRMTIVAVRALADLALLTPAVLIIGTLKLGTLQLGNLIR